MYNKSIYKIICDNLTLERRLPVNFLLPEDEPSPNQLRFSPGAKDGIGIFHTGEATSEKAAMEIEELLRNEWKKKSTFMAKLFSQKQVVQNTEKIAALLQEQGALSVIDLILNSIRQDHAGIDVSSMIDYAKQLAFESDDEELVKLGVALLGIIDLTNSEELIDQLLTLALFEEFTLYVAVAISKTQNGNELLFEIAQKSDGWGKISVVERLEPQTDKIKYWLLRNGCENSVMDAYLGLVCAEKGDLISTLRYGDLDEELFDGVSVIINALIDEGPVDGISAYDHAEEAMRLYLWIAKSHVATMKHFWYILNVQDWLEDSEISSKEELQYLCNEITNKSECVELIQNILQSPEDVRFFYAVNAARRLNIDISQQLFEAVKANPIKHSGYLSWLYDKPKYAIELTKLYEGILQLDKMEKGMGDYLFATKLRAEHNCLGFVLQELGNYPNTGEHIIRTALLSPVVGERDGATNALLEWSNRLDKSLADISPLLFSIVRDLALIEVNLENQESMNQLL